MKNTDMKVIAIILTVALCLTVLTSNVVSIASVVILAKGSTGATVEAGTNAGTSTDVDAPAGNAGTQTQTPAGNSGSTTPTQASSGNTGATQAPSGNTGATQAPSGNTGATQAPAATNGIDAEALAMFQKAAAEINGSGAAGYTKLSWQEIKEFKASDNATVNDALKGLIGNFMTSKEKAEQDPKISDKGSEDAMRRFPASNCSQDKIKSVTKKEANGNYIITIVLKDENNLTKADTDGLNVMSRDILYIEDVRDTVQNDATVSKIVTDLKKAEINYKEYTITAEMTKDGKFVNVTHYCEAELAADADGKVLVVPFSVSGSGVLAFNVIYKDFKY
ncbi:MAG: hypothetical protein J6B35_03855 [Clostridia bacterium]|nr:hypothetical protein [Clostridia bacterium]